MDVEETWCTDCLEEVEMDCVECASSPGSEMCSDCNVGFCGDCWNVSLHANKQKCPRCSVMLCGESFVHSDEELENYRVQLGFDGISDLCRHCIRAICKNSMQNDLMDDGERF